MDASLAQTFLRRSIDSCMFAGADKICFPKILPAQSPEMLDALLRRLMLIYPCGCCILQRKWHVTCVVLRASEVPVECSCLAACVVTDILFCRYCADKDMRPIYGYL